MVAATSQRLGCARRTTHRPKTCSSFNSGEWSCPGTCGGQCLEIGRIDKHPVFGRIFDGAEALQAITKALDAE